MAGVEGGGMIKGIERKKGFSPGEEPGKRTKTLAGAMSWVRAKV